MRLLDSILAGRSERFNEADASGASLVYQWFGTPNQERIQPTWANAVEAYASSGVVFGIILARMSLFSEAEFKLQNKATKKLYGSPALEKLEKPWPGGNTGELLCRMEQDASLAGNAYIRDAGDRLERLRPDWVTIVSEIVLDGKGEEIREVIGYFYDPPKSEGRCQAFYPVEEVAHWSPIPDPVANFRGMSWLTPVLREINADVQMTDYKRAYLENAATPNLLIKYKQRLGQAKIDVLRDQMNARHGGTANAFRTMVLDEGADPMTVGNTFEQMNFTAVQAAGENRIAVAAGVPGIVAGLKEGLDAATYSNYGQALRRFADMTARPNWRSACGALEKLIVVPADSKLWYDPSEIAALREGEKERAEIVHSQSQAAILLIQAGWEPGSVRDAIQSGDLSLLNHTGLVPISLYQDVPPTTGVKP